MFGIDTNLGGWVPHFSENWDFCVWYRYQLRGGGSPLFFKTRHFRVGIDTKLGGGGVHWFQISKSQVLGPWVGILDLDPPLEKVLFSSGVKI